MSPRRKPGFLKGAEEPAEPGHLLTPMEELEELVGPLTEDQQKKFYAGVFGRHIGRAAGRQAEAELAAYQWREPTPYDRGSLSDHLLLERPGPAFLIEGLLGASHNVVFAAQHKTGKTTTVSNVVHALVDGMPFLGRATALPRGRRVGWVNAEMDPYDLAEALRPMNIAHPDRVAMWHARGRTVSLFDPRAAEDFTTWLVDERVEVLVVDSWRRLCAWSGVNENLNEEVERLTARVDELKAATGVNAVIVIAHTGRGEALDGHERARGATALDDWADARWILTKDGEGTRFFAAPAARGGVEFAETAVVLDRAHNLLDLGEGNRSTSVSAELVEKIVGVVSESPSSSTNAVTRALGVKSKNGRLTDSAFQKAERDELIYHECSPMGTGRKRSWFPGPRPDSSTCSCEPPWCQS